jgi:hypothetical protein
MECGQKVGASNLHGSGVQPTFWFFCEDIMSKLTESEVEKLEEKGIMYCESCGHQSKRAKIDKAVRDRIGKRFDGCDALCENCGEAIPYCLD